jgi:hypothetical protein
VCHSESSRVPPRVASALSQDEYDFDKSDIIHNVVDYAEAAFRHHEEVGAYAKAAADGVDGAPKPNSVPGMLVIHCDDMSAWDFPAPMHETVGDTRVHPRERSQAEAPHASAAEWREGSW